MHPLHSATNQLIQKLDQLHFAAPTSHVYNPLVYARKSHDLYLNRYGLGKKRVLFLGMNPGPFGMTQTGVPFGEIAAVRDWMKITAPVASPEHQNPKRPITGFDCKNSEVSGRRLWGLFAQRFGAAENFFKEHFVINYCPLVFMEEGGKNRTPDKLPNSEIKPVYEACDDFLTQAVDYFQPEWLIGVGAFAAGRAKTLLPKFPDLKVSQVLHPSPASPLANKDWPGEATKTMEKLGVW